MTERAEHSTQQTKQSLSGRRFSSRRFATKDARILVVGGPHKGDSLDLTRELTQIGRGDWCDLVLSRDLQMSKEHCEVELREDGVLLRDLGSRNGLYCQDVRIVEAFLQPDTTWLAGESLLQLQSSQQPTEITVPYYDKSQSLIGSAPTMRKLFAHMERLARQPIPIVLCGETGTGKTSMAQAIHKQSQRSEQPFVIVNCGAISASLMEGLFFGYEKGAFTGADKRHKGYFEQAHGGTLFLDELGELPLELQPKLLDALERGQVKRLGSEVEIPIDVRLISSTHRDLLHEVKAGRFRQDLYYRVAVSQLSIPPLRERVDDIPLLIEWLLSEVCPGETYALTDEAQQVMARYLWPGNVRQLRNVLQSTIALRAPTAVEDPFIQAAEINLPEATDESEGASSPHVATSAAEAHEPSDVETGEGPCFVGIFSELKAFIEHQERRALREALAHTSWHIPNAAKILGISKVWMYKRVKKYGLTPPEGPSAS